jgi:uncharacterized phage protein (predicted DNA packaging)
MDTLLEKVKANLIIDGDEDDEIIQNFINAAVSYAEGVQHVGVGYYGENEMLKSTEQAVIMLSSHFYESRDGGSGGFFNETVSGARQIWQAVDRLLSVDKNWRT